MVITKTQTLHLETPAASIALSPDENLLAVVGCHLFKIYTVKEDGQLQDRINLRSSKHQNLNYSSSDVEFCPTDDRILASASTNGSVIVWNITNSGKAKLTNVFKDHDRTVNRINFHPNDQHLVLSGSQDGLMKLFDCRKNESVQTFSSNSESVRDIQFNPHLPYYFAAGTDSCNVQLWDTRRPDKYERLITGHRGPVFALDWHPQDRHCIVTASRDCTIKIWDVSEQATVTSAITTVAAVARVKWRPTHYYHLASCSLAVDSSACIWDVQRPFVPTASFAYHRGSTAALQWRPKSNSFITVSKDGRLFHHCLSEGYRPQLRGCPFPLAVSPLGDVTFSAPTRAKNKEKAIADNIEKLEAKTVVSHKRQTSLTNPISSGGGSTASSPAATGPASFTTSERIPSTPLNPATPTLPPNPNNNADLNFNLVNFPPPNLGMRDLATFEDIGPILSEFSMLSYKDDGMTIDTLRDYGLHYRLSGGTNRELFDTCDHNAGIATRNGRLQEAQVWSMLKVICTGDEPEGATAPAAVPGTAASVAAAGASAAVAAGAGGDTKGAADSKWRADGTCSDKTAASMLRSPSKEDDVLDGDDKTIVNEDDADDDSDSDSDEEDLEDRLRKGLNKTTFPSLYTNGRLPQTDLYFGDSDFFQDTFAIPHNPMKRSSKRNKKKNHHYYNNNMHNIPDLRRTFNNRPLSSNEELFVIRDEAFEPKALHSYMAKCDRYDSVDQNGDLADDSTTTHSHHMHHSMDSGGEGDSGEMEMEREGRGGKRVLAVTMPLAISQSALPPTPAFDYMESVVDTLKFTALRGDIATCVTAIIVLGDRVKSRIPEDLLEHWFLMYVDQLQRLQLFNRATVIIQNAEGIPSVQHLNQNSTVISSMCPQCHARLPPRAFCCRKCRTVVNKCSWCHEVVVGLYVVCQGCCHGGHLHHIADWFREKKKLMKQRTPDEAFSNYTVNQSTMPSMTGNGISRYSGSSAAGNGCCSGAAPSYNGNPFLGATVTSNVFAAASASSSPTFTEMGNLVCPAGCGHLCQYM